MYRDVESAHAQSVPQAKGPLDWRRQRKGSSFLSAGVESCFVRQEYADTVIVANGRCGRRLLLKGVVKYCAIVGLWGAALSKSSFDTRRPLKGAQTAKNHQGAKQADCEI
jgi:hypothetical protein